MESGRRALKIGVAAAALGAIVAASGDAKASAGEDVVLGLVGVGTLGFIGADLAFAGHDIDSAMHNRLPRDGWLIGETAVSIPQTLVFNTILVGFNTADDETMALLATAIGTLPTAGVTALTTHGIWGLADEKTDADAMAGISVLVGLDFALTASAIGRAVARRVHNRGIGIFEMVLATPGTAVGIYESTFTRPQQGAWIGLTAWSGALLVHGLVSTIIDDDGKEHEPQRAAGLTRALGQAPFTVVPTFLSDGVARMPGLVAAGTF